MSYRKRAIIRILIDVGILGFSLFMFLQAQLLSENRERYDDILFYDVLPTQLLGLNRVDIEAYLGENTGTVINDPYGEILVRYDTDAFFKTDGKLYVSYFWAETYEEQKSYDIVWSLSDGVTFSNDGWEPFESIKKAMYKLYGQPDYAGSTSDSWHIYDFKDINGEIQANGNVLLSLMFSENGEIHFVRLNEESSILLEAEIFRGE